MPETTIIAFKSYKESKHLWRIRINNVEYTASFGGIVYKVLNEITTIKNEDSTCSANFLSESIKENIPKWEKHFDELIDVINKKNKLDTETLYGKYERFKTFAYCIFQNKDFNQTVRYYWKNKDTANFFERAIVFRGYEMLADNNTYQKFEILDVSGLFLLDLWELFFNPDLKQKITKCKECGEYFISNHGNRKYCNDCQAHMSEIQNRNRNEKEDQKLNKRIQDRLRQRELNTKPKANDNDTKESEQLKFINESYYYKDLIEGKEVKCNPEYTENIKTREDYINWLNKKSEEYSGKRGRPKKCQKENC